MVLEVRTNYSDSCLALSPLSIFKIVGCIVYCKKFFLNRLALLISMWSPGSKMKWRTVIFETSPTKPCWLVSGYLYLFFIVEFLVDDFTEAGKETKSKRPKGELFFSSLQKSRLFPKIVVSSRLRPYRKEIFVNCEERRYSVLSLGLL